jgi:1A family penicillin-binding protein
MAKSAVVTSAATSPPPRFKHSFWWYMKWMFITLQLIVFCALVVAACVGKGLYDELQKVVPDLRVLLAKNRSEPTRVYAADNSLLAEFRNEDRVWIPINQLKVWKTWQGQTVQRYGRLMQATLSIEDSRFYQHPGVDAKRVAGALVANFKARDIKQGGSTITEQLVDNVYLTLKRDFRTRLNSSLIALQLERKLSKDEIFEAYLNEIYYGNRCYGAEAGSQLYFGKPARDLTISEAALLAGIPQSPTRHDPFKNFENSKKRQRIVLGEMLQNKYITYAQYNEARTDKSLPITLKRQHEIMRKRRANVPRWKSPYFVSYVEGYLKKNYGYDVREPGLKVYTTLDPKLQRIAEKSLVSEVARRGSTLQGALVSVDPWTGHVVAMVGGRNYYNTSMNGQFNRAVQGKRQPGSTMKPYIYAAALEAGMTPNSVEVDNQFWVCGDSECPPNKRSKRRGGHEIRNYTRSHSGSMTLKRAIGESNNVIATKVLLKTGIQNVIQKSHLMGIQSSLVPVPTLALGVSEISLLEHVSAYGVFATKGLRAEPTPVVRVENYSGDVLLEQPTPVRAARVLSPEAANGIYDMLRYVVTNGTGRTVQIRGVELLGKTGTTSSNKDVWFMGASPELVCGVWMGYDQPKPLGGSSAGGRWCGPVFREYMEQALPIWKARRPLEKLIEDSRTTAQRRFLAQQYKQYVTIRICNESGLLATKDCQNTHKETFSSAGGAPTTYCTVHRSAVVQQPLTSAPDTGRSSPPRERITNSRDDNSTQDYQQPPIGEDGNPISPDNSAAQDYYRERRRNQENSVQAYEGDGVMIVPDNGGGTIIPEDAPQPSAPTTDTSRGF